MRFKTPEHGTLRHRVRFAWLPLLGTDARTTYWLERVFETYCYDSLGGWFEAGGWKILVRKGMNE